MTPTTQKKCYAGTKKDGIKTDCPNNGKQWAAVLPLGASYLYLCETHGHLGRQMGYIQTEK